MIMKKRLALSIMMIGCILTTSASAQEDDVYVDLSVLDGLSSAPVIVSGNATEPLFPIVKKAPKAKKNAKSKIARKKVKKNIAKATPKPSIKEAKVEVKPQQIPYVESTESVVVVDVEPTPATPDASALQVNLQESVSVAPAPAAVVEEKKVESPEVTENKTSELLIDENTQREPNLNNGGHLVFSEGTDTLTEEHKVQIDTIIASFENALVNKIAIYSYNLDDGVDVFKKKRLSLNRAVEVRSYLLPKGYKNFSIKVVNVDTASGKANTVEIEELKN